MGIMIEMKIVPRISERLAEMRRKSTWLSEQTGIDKGSLSRIIGGKMVSLETAFSISAALGVSVESLWRIKEVEIDEESRS